MLYPFPIGWSHGLGGTKIGDCRGCRRIKEDAVFYDRLDSGGCLDYMTTTNSRPSACPSSSCHDILSIFETVGTLTDTRPAQKRLYIQYRY